MASLLDAIGAFIIGGILLLTMVNALFNVHATAVDIEQQIILSEVTERLARILSDYLSLAGAGPDAAILDSTGVHRLRFSVNYTFTSETRIVDFMQGDSTAQGFPLNIFVDDELEGGPYFLSEPLQIDYFDEADNLIALSGDLVPSGSLDDIRYARLEMEFFYDAFAPIAVPGPDRRDPKNRIVLWRYFMNMYL